MTRIFEQIRAVSWPLIALSVVVYSCATMIVSAVLFQGRISASLGSLYVATGSLIQSALVGGLFSLAVISVVLFGFGRLRPFDVGWRARELRLGALITFIFWIAMNAVLAVIAAFNRNIELHETWTQEGTSAAIGALVGQLLGNSLAEETMFRGFLLPQLYLKTVSTMRHRAALTLAFLGSSALFAITHLPNRYYIHGLAGMEFLWDQCGLLLFGLIFAAVYVVTRNLFIAVGLHALVNAPTPLVRSSGETVHYAVWAGLTAILLLAWWAVGLARNRSQS